MEAVIANAHLDVIFNLQEGLSRQEWSEFMADVGHEFTASCMCCAHQGASKAKEAKEPINPRKPGSQRDEKAKDATEPS